MNLETLPKVYGTRQDVVDCINRVCRDFNMGHASKKKLEEISERIEESLIHVLPTCAKLRDIDVSTPDGYTLRIIATFDGFQTETMEMRYPQAVWSVGAP